MSNQPVTVAQAEQVRKVANDKGLTRRAFSENFLDNGLVGMALDAVKRGSMLVNVGIPMIRLPEITICAIDVERNLSPRWEDLVREGCPQTPESGSSIWAAGDAFIPQKSGFTLDDTLFLVKFTNEGDRGWGRAFWWKEQLGLEETDPRWVLSLAKNRPRFHRDLGLPITIVVATQAVISKGQPSACAVYWDQGGREAVMNHPESFGAHNCWFAFQAPQL